MADVITDCLGGCELRKFDQVNRITIPGAYRSRLGKQVYLLKNFQSTCKANNCIIAYSAEEYLKFFERLSEIYSGEVLAKAQRKVSASVDRAIIDKDGRITLKPEFMEFAALTEDALIVCQPNKIEFWNPERWDNLFADEEQTDEDEGEMPDFSKITF